MSTQSQKNLPYRFLTSYKKGTWLSLEWRNLADTTLTKRSKLAPSITRPQSQPPVPPDVMF